MAKKQLTIGVKIDFVLYKSDGEHVAHALVMDIVGTGSTEREAIKELKGAICCQMVTCIKKQINPFRHAPNKYFEQWNNS